METGVVVRDYEPGDEPRIREIHERMGLDFRLPDLNAPLIFVKKVLVVDGVIVAACALRVEAEQMMWVDKDFGDTEEKTAAYRLLQDEELRDPKLSGLQQLVAWVPRHVEKAFAPHLKKLGWTRDRQDFVTWSRDTHD